MSSLLDIALPKEAVPIGGATVDCFGITVADLVNLLERHPKLRDVLWQGNAGRLPGETNIDASTLMGEAPDAIAGLLAAGTGHLGDPKAEDIAARLPLQAQVDLLAAILRLTLPDGLGPFMAKFTALFGAVGEVQSRLPQTVSDENRQPLPNGKAGPGISSPLPLSD